MPTSLSLRLRQANALDLLKAILIGTIVVFAGAAGYMSLLIFERQESLSKVSRYDVAWSASQGANEYIRLFQRLTALAESPGATRQQSEVLLRFEILKGRLGLFESGEFRTFVGETEERQTIVRRLSNFVAELDGMTDRIEDPEIVRKILLLMAPLEADLIGLASEAASFSSAEITEFEQELLKLHRIFSAIALGFFLCTSAFVALLAWNNRLLTRTHLRLQEANQDLQHVYNDLARMAHHDQLTDLPNRLLLQEHLEAVFARKGGGPATTAMMCLDLDNFKNVNDTLGHPVGDALLCGVARRVTELVGQKGLVARFGGDEFVIVLQNCDPECAAELAESLIQAIAEPYNLHGHRVIVGTSIGIAFATDAGADPDTLLRNADLALYRAKADGRGSYRFFETEMYARLERRRLLELELLSANFDTDFELHFQPLIHLQTRKATSVEVLARWARTSQGAVSPDEFIPIAEASDLIVSLGEWVLRKACAVATSLPPEISVTVNLSAIQFRRSNIVETIFAVLSETGLSPNRLELEITETLLLDDSEEVHRALRELRSRGMRISLDDFGTGYSSLGYLRKFKVDKVKIDRSFVAGIADDADHRAIIQAVVGLTRALGMTSVAEGIENEEQLLFIRASGCNEGQGYLFSPPLAEDEIKKFLAHRRVDANVA